MMDKEVPTIVPETQNNNNHHNDHSNSYSLEDGKDDEDLQNEVAKCSSNNDVVSDGDAEVNNINNKDVTASEAERTNDSANYSPFPPCKIARRSKDSNRKSVSSPRMKTSTPNSMVGTPAGSSSEREPNSSPASIDNPPTNGSINVSSWLFGLAEFLAGYQCTCFTILLFCRMTLLEMVKEVTKLNQAIAIQ